MAGLQISPIEQLRFHQTTKQEEAIDEVFDAFIKAMSEERGLRRWYIGHRMTNSLELVGVRFTAIHEATQNEARELEVFAVQKLLEVINSSEKLRPYLKEHPFTAEHLVLRICFRDDGYCNYWDGSMESVLMDKNEITYFQELPVGVRDESKYILPGTPVYAKETYEDAVKVVNNSLPSN